MNSSVRIKPQVSDGNGQAAESREEKLRRVRQQVNNGFYSRHEVLKDVADALLMNPVPFENLNEKETT